jgi:insertion element IS1 protein InsB
MDLEDRATGRLIDWECGDERTFRRLFERLARWKVRLFCSDSYVVYPLVLGGHYQGMIERRVALFAHFHVNKEAAPEMYRLPIQAGRIFTLA